MSADNWTICPMCVNKSIALKELFVNKYYGKLEPFVYNKILEEVNNAVKHIESESSDEYEPNKEILKLMEEKNIEVNYMGDNYSANEILQEGNQSTTLREDYEQGVEKKGDIYFDYSCACDCGFNKKIRFEESKHLIIDKGGKKNE